MTTTQIKRALQTWLSLCLFLLALFGAAVSSYAAVACHSAWLGLSAKYAYYGHYRTTDGYDDNDGLRFAYDARSALVTGEKKFRVNEDHGTLAKFAEFLAAKGGEQGGLNLFRAGPDGLATREATTGWKEGDRMLNLPNQGSPKANWTQNAGRLREEMGNGEPIFDSEVPLI